MPNHFAMDDAEISSTLAALTAADLITPTADGLLATFLPLLWDQAAGSLLGHVARNNPHWRHADSAAESLVIVRGPDAYVSPGWYTSKAEHGRVVPTWNYVTLHVHGRLIAHDDVDWLRSLVTRLTDRHEAALDHPWAVTDAPPAFIDGQLRAIVGVELQISRIEAKAKLSQNRPAADQAGVVNALTHGSPREQEVAAMMTVEPTDS